MTHSRELSDLLADAIERASAGVVQIQGRCVQSSGSIWSRDGVLVASLHTLERSDALRVTLHDGRCTDAQVVARDPALDLAILRADAQDLVPLSWSDGAGLRVGHLVTPIARVEGRVRATLGMVSSLRGQTRTAQGGTLARLIEVDGALPRGFSGGPLLDHHGDALGMNTAALVRGGTTIPTETLRALLPALLAGTHGARGYLGVGVQPVRVPEAVAHDAPQRWGLMVVSLDPTGPAARDGLHVGDVILALDDLVVQHPGDLIAALSGRAEQAIRLRVARAGAIIELSLSVGTSAQRRP